MSESDNNDKPILLKAIELVLADPASIKREAKNVLQKYSERWGGYKSENEIRSLAADEIISNYSYVAAVVGAGTALVGVIPGLGTVLAAFGGATADAALSMKYQIEMTMAIATAYGHDIEDEEEMRLCLIIAGLGTINESAKGGGKQISQQAFIRMTKQYLKGTTLQAVKEIFKKVGITFTRKAFEKAIPFGIGAVIGFSANKGLTWYVGNKVKGFFSVKDDEDIDNGELRTPPPPPPPLPPSPCVEDSDYLLVER